MSEKTQQPTPKKRNDALKKGQVARSKLLPSAATTLGGLLPLLACGPGLWRDLSIWTRTLLLTQETAPHVALHDGLVLLATGIAPCLLGATLASFAASLAMSGFHFNPALVAPKLERLDVSEGFKKLFSARQLVDVLKGLGLGLLLGVLFFVNLRDDARTAFSSVQLDGAHAFLACLALLKPLVRDAAVLLLIFGLADWALARHRHTKDLMMSHDEVKQEHKNADGDPHQKAKRKALHRQFASGGPARGVQRASAVVVNPTHVAVALRYAEAECDAPYIVARGQEEDALKLRREAEALGIPVVRDIPLARSLIHYDVGEQVPEELYQAAAAILKVALENQERES